MLSIKERHGRYVKSMAIAAILVGSTFLAMEFYFIYTFWMTPRASTCFFHFNFQYRAGVTEIENNIIREPYYKLLQVFDRHPTWNFTIELQAAMIERMMESPEFEEILNLTRKLNHRGQMEIICGLYSSQIVHAYPQQIIEWNFRYAYKILEAANLSRSRVLLCQEGQTALGIANVLNTNWSEGIDTLLVPWQTLHTFIPPGESIPNVPVYTVDNVVPNKSMNVLVYDYFPKVEAGFMHTWPWVLDAELVAEQEDPAIEFDVDEDALRFFEEQWTMLEGEGNKFFTLNQWMKHCEEVNAVKPLNFYFPESTWGPTMYNSSFTWMGNNKGTTDDGEMIANNRRGYFTVEATKIMYNYYLSQLSQENRTDIENLLEEAEKSVLLATVTDTTGLNPRGYERIYGEDNIFKAMLNCSEAISLMVSEIPVLSNNSIYQIDLLKQTIENNSLNFNSPVFDEQLTLSDLPFTIEAFTNPNTSQFQPSIKLGNYSFEGFDYKSLEVSYLGSWDWVVDSPEELHLKFNLNSSNIFYCPSLTDSINLTKEMERSGFISHPLYIFLPLSNGLIFFPDQNNKSKGLALINNCTSRHTAIRWESDYLEYWENNGIHMNASYQILILEEVQLIDAVNFAQRINNHPFWIISDNITRMAGYYPYNLYSQVANADT